MSDKKRVYMDYAASTPADERVVAAMEPYWNDVFGNPNAIHEEGRKGGEALKKARERIAGFLNAESDELVFTSGGTESNALAIMGYVDRLVDEGGEFADMHFVTSAIEHPSVIDCFKKLKRRGASVSFVGVDSEGILDLDAFAKELRDDTTLVSIMQANNEIGTIQPVQETVRMTRKKSPQAVFHTDASQTPLFFDIDVRSLNVDMLTIDAQKIYGPKGVGALFVRRGIRLNTIACGGSQEKGLRPGTQHVPAIVGFATAYEIVEEERKDESRRLTELRDYMLAEVRRTLPAAVLNGSESQRLPNNLNFSFPGTESEHTVILLDEKGVGVSARSACIARGVEGSYVVFALDPTRARSAVRFSMGKATTKDDVDFVVGALNEIFLKG